MPKKPNSHGDMQNYVPPGNGDASGEYADGEGSNVHYFSEFKKPVEEAKETIAESPKTISEKASETRWSEVKDKKGLSSSITRELRYGKTPEQITQRLDKLKFLFGLEGMSADDIKKIVDLVKDAKAGESASESDYFWYKEGKKWYGSREKGIAELLGYKTYTSEEKDAIEEQAHQKALKMSPTQQGIVDDLRKQGYNGTISFAGLNDENSKKVGNAMKTTFNDFPKLKEQIVSFGTEKGVTAQVEEDFKKHLQSPDYKKRLEEYTKRVRDMNPNAYISEEKAEQYYKRVWLSENTRVATDKTNFWGCCGLANGGANSWIQIKNTQYKRYEEDNRLSIEKLGYPANVGASFEATSYHEMGHALANYLFKQGVFGYSDDQSINKIKEIRKKYEKPISSYGKASIAEYIAECFASHYVDGNNDQANEVWQFMMDKYKEKNQ